MGIEFIRPRSIPSRLPFVKVPPARWVAVLSHPDDYVCLMLHWSEASNSSVPCVGKGCRLCADAPLPYCYAPCLLFAASDGTWQRAILPIGDPARSFALQEFEGKCVEIVRAGDKDVHSPFVAKRVRPLEQRIGHSPLALPFDIRPHLLRRWGMFDESSLDGCKFHMPTQEEGVSP